MTTQQFTSVWGSLEDTPQQASNMKLRSKMIIEVANHIDRAGLTQVQAAKLFDVSPPRISDLQRGKVALFSLDALVNMLAAAGLRVSFKIEAAESERQEAVSAVTGYGSASA